MIESPIIGAISAGLKWLLGLFPAILGAGISVFIKNSEKEKLNLRQKGIFFFCGVAIAYIFSNAIFEHLTIDPRSFIGIAVTFTIGLFGMGATIQLSKQLPEIIRGFWNRLLDLLPTRK